MSRERSRWPLSRPSFDFLGCGILRRDDSLVDGPVDQFDNGMDIEFVHDVVPVSFHGIDADTQGGSHLFVSVPRREEWNNFFLACRQNVALDAMISRFRRASLGGFQDEFRCFSGKKRFVLAEGLTGGHQFASIIGFQYVGAGARGQHFTGHLLGLVQRNNEHLRMRYGLQDLAGGFQTTQLRQGDVHHDHVRFQLLGFLEGFLAGNCLAADLPPGVGFQELSDSSPGRFVVVRHKNPDLIHALAPWRGRVALTTVPEPLDSRSSRPPNCLTRSLMPATPTPSPTPPAWNFFKVSQGIPRPSSRISNLTLSVSRTSSIHAVRLPE